MRETIRRVTAWALTLTPVRAFLHYTEHGGPRLADAITYRALFSVFAAVLLGFSVAAAWLAGDPDAMHRLTTTVDAVIPGLVGSGGLVDPAAITAPAGLTIAGVVGAAGLVGAALGAIASTRAALRTIADQTGDDGFFLWVLLRNLGLAVAIALGIVASAAATFFVTVLAGLVRDWVGPAATALVHTLTYAGTVLVVFVLDAGIVALLFVVLSGLRAPAGAIIPGAVIGGVGLTVLQQLSSLFVRGATSNPLLASFAALIALLLWMNLSAQVLLVACSYIVVRVRERDDRVRERFGSPTMAARRIRRAEDAVQVAVGELERARSAAGTTAGR
ncbi:YihY/virulence factor BrkB family protein [Microbacterium luticocti]|uniref:YihY/virulence factor BrkB family protein n=1 Tax=Microbacterium luticocti TaxID=451764 RepID=UPI000406F5BA|nr:YihY/virulence factor BrkB family protein [Microbacterium luticocti]